MTHRIPLRARLTTAWGVLRGRPTVYGIRCNGITVAERGIAIQATNFGGLRIVGNHVDPSTSRTS